MVQPGAFYECTIPENIETLRGPVPLDVLPPGVDNRCRAVTHRLIKQKSGKSSGISIYLIHSLPLGLSAVQLFVGDKMALVAHTVGADTIGCMKELYLDSMFSETGWRAMLLKDNNGDIGILVAAWKGSSSTGACSFLYFDLRSKEYLEFNMPDKEGKYRQAQSLSKIKVLHY